MRCNVPSLDFVGFDCMYFYCRWQTNHPYCWTSHRRAVSGPLTHLNVSLSGQLDPTRGSISAEIEGEQITSRNSITYEQPWSLSDYEVRCYWKCVLSVPLCVQELSIYVCTCDLLNIHVAVMNSGKTFWLQRSLSVTQFQRVLSIMFMYIHCSMRLYDIPHMLCIRHGKWMWVRYCLLLHTSLSLCNNITPIFTTV